MEDSAGKRIGGLGKLAKIGGLAIKTSNVINTAFNSQPVGNKGVIVMNTQRYNHHSGQYLPSPGSSGNSGNSNSSDKSSKGLYGLNFTSEFSGGNNGRHGQTDEAPINADFIMAITSSWMGEDIKFAKTWEEIIEKLPNRLKEANEMVKTFEELKQRKELEDYI